MEPCINNVSDITYQSELTLDISECFGMNKMSSVILDRLQRSRISLNET